MIDLVRLPEHVLPGLFDGTFPPGVYRWQPERPAAATSNALQWAADADWHGVALNLDEVRDKAAFLDRCAAELALPEWFGRNWDALADCLTDLSWWGRPRGFLVLVDQWRAFQEAAPVDAAIAADIFAAAADYWAVRDTPLTVLLE